jgi:hypothetical protein
VAVAAEEEETSEAEMAAEEAVKAVAAPVVGKRPPVASTAAERPLAAWAAAERPPAAWAVGVRPPAAWAVGVRPPAALAVAARQPALEEREEEERLPEAWGEGWHQRAWGAVAAGSVARCTASAVRPKAAVVSELACD